MTPEMYQAVAQRCHETQQEQQAEEWGFATLELATLVRRWGRAAVLREVMSLPETPPQATFAHQPICSQCVNWRPARAARRGDGRTTPVGGFCEVRAAAELVQMPSDYARCCPFYEENIPF